MDEYDFCVTGYVGFEDETLQLRNTNRLHAQSREYLDWRYATYPGAPDPLIFWIRSGSGSALGMASMIFRPYWIDGAQVYIGVIGDISLDSRLRGKGLGLRLMCFIKKYLEQHSPDQVAFVIPNDAARKSLLAAHWEPAGMLVPYVLQLNPANKLKRLLKSELLARVVSAPVSTLIRLGASLHIQQGYGMTFGTTPDDSFETLWSQVPKANQIMGDRRPGYLTWRYTTHPHHSFQFARLLRGSDLAGYIIFRYCTENHACWIYDALVKDGNDLLCMLSLFIEHAGRYGHPDTISILLSDKHPFRGALWKLGFIRRRSLGSFLVRWPQGHSTSSSLNWFLGSGDKDI